MMNHDEHMQKVTEESTEEKEISSWRRKLIWSWIFTIPIAILMLSERIFGMALIEMPYNAIVILILAFPVVFIFGFHTIKSGIRGLFTFYFNMDSLISLGTIIAFLTGIFALTGAIADYSGVSAMIMAFF